MLKKKKLLLLLSLLNGSMTCHRIKGAMKSLSLISAIICVFNSQKRTFSAKQPFGHKDLTRQPETMDSCQLDPTLVGQHRTAQTERSGCTAHIT